MKTLNDEELSAMLRNIFKVYENNNAATIKLMEMVETVKDGRKRLYSQKEMLELADVGLELCKIIHAITEQAHNVFSEMVPALRFVHEVAAGAQQVSDVPGE